jgi:hypothetical protein
MLRKGDSPAVGLGTQYMKYLTEQHQGPVQLPETPNEPNCREWYPDSRPNTDPHPHDPRASWIDPVAAALRPHQRPLRV